MLSPQIVEKSSFTVVGLEDSFIHALSPEPTNVEVIGPLWNKFIGRAAEVPHRIGHDMFGVIWGRPETERKHPHELQYLAGVSASSDVKTPTGMFSRTIAAGTFAVFTHHGPIHKIADTVSEIYRVWLPQSGYERAQNADVELYDHRFCGDSDESEMEYWISVTPRAPA